MRTDLLEKALQMPDVDSDRNVNYQDYGAHGVREYWIVNPGKQIIEQYVLEDETHELRVKAADGVVKSVAVEGFSIPVRAVFDEAENARVLARLWRNV